MATISVSAYNDSAARTAGESITITSGAVWTVRTDYRVHANAPASNLGALASITVTEGECVWDSTAIRWLSYNTGSGNVPAIGTMVTQGAVSGYLLGVWASKTVAQTAVGAAMPATGFLKFREVTGGDEYFVAGALAGIGATATAEDVQGWMSLPHDAGATFTVPRLGKHTARGGQFFLETCTGNVGQIFQVPTDGSTAFYAPGLWVETDVDSSQYEYWPGLYSSTNGWSHLHIGEAKGYSDARQNYVKILAGGQLQMGEDYSQASTYASLAAQASTYATLAHTCSYTWVNNVVLVYIATGHELEDGMQTGLDFTSGGATAYDGIYTVTVLDPYHFTVPLAGSGASGAVTSRPGVTITFASHGLNLGESVYCDFTSGTGVDGTYQIFKSGTTYAIKYPHTVALTAGNVSVLHTLVVTFTAHGLAVGNQVTLDFTSGTGVDGKYVIKVVAANTYNINFPHSATTSGNVTMIRQIGNVAPAGCKTWIPSNILHEVATGARATNTIPNATIASRPEWSTVAAGAVDLSYVYGCSGYLNFGQAFAITLQNSAYFDSIIIAETATYLDIYDLHTSMCTALDVAALQLTSNFAGGFIGMCKFMRGNVPNTSDHNITVGYCKNITFYNVLGGILQYPRSSGYAFTISYCDKLVFDTCKTQNSVMSFVASTNIEVVNHDHCDRISGKTNATSALYLFSLGAGCTDFKIDNITFGLGGTIADNQPFTGVLSYTASQRVILRNMGTRTAPLSGGTWAPNLTSTAYIINTGGNNSDVKVQRCYIDKVRTAPFTTVNSDKNMLYESIFGGSFVWSSKSYLALNHADLNGVIKGCEEIHSVTGQSSVYGTHFYDVFTGPGYGRVILPFNEPTAETFAVFEMNVGTAKFNSSGGLLLSTIGWQATFTDNVYRIGHTGFDITEAVLSGPTQTRFDIHYAIDTGAGFGAFHNLYYQRAGGSGSSGAYTFSVTDATNVEIGDYVWGTGVGQFARVTNKVSNTLTVNVANSATVSGTLRFNHLPFESIDPTLGFKLQFRLTVIATETVACAYLRVDTLSSSTAQANNLYELDAGVPISLLAQTVDGTPVPGAQVLLTVSTSSGLPNNDTIASLVNSGTTATVTHNSHNLITYDKVKIKGASLYQNNGVFTIVKVDNNTYTYTLPSAPGSNPTGDIKCTFVFLYGTTDSNGLISTTRILNNNYAVTGWARKSSSTPFYKTAPVTGTVNRVTGTSFSALLIPDE